MRPQLILLGRTLLFAVGLAATLAALLSSPLGLGDKTDFILYQLWGFPRASTLYTGALLILASFLPKQTILLKIRDAIHRDFRIAVINDTRIETAPTHWMSYLVQLISQLALALFMASIAFWLNRSSLLGYIDGQYLLELTKNQWDFADWSFGFSANPLQGLGDLWYFSNSRWIPELLVARLSSDINWQRVAIHCTAFIEIFAVVALLSYWLGLIAERAIASAWLAVLAITPLTFPSLIYNISPDAPQIAALITLPLIIVPMLIGIGRGRKWLDAAQSLAIGALVWLYFLAFGLFAALALPFLATVWAVFLAASWPSRNEFWRKATWGGLLFVGLITSGMPQILLGMVRDSAFYSFPHDLIPSGRTLSDGSILLRVSEPVGLLIAWLGIIGATYHAVLGRGHIRWFALAVAIFAAMIFFGSLLYAFVGWSGAKPIYYEYMLWPVYPIFAASLLGTIWTANWPRLSKALKRFHLRLDEWCWLALPMAAVVILHGPNYLRNVHSDRPNIYPPAPTALTEYLRDRIGLVPGAQFNGRVVTLTGQGLPPRATWDQMFAMDLNLLRTVGNEHRSVGLWYYGIPTLIEFSHTIPALYYAVMKHHFAYNDDLQVRNLLNIRRPNIHALRQLGVRYVISDSPRPVVGTQRVLEMSLPGTNASLALDEISNPNLGVSPAEIILQPSSKEAIDWLGEPRNDFNRLALLAGPDPGPLTVATDIEIKIEPGGINVRAKSVGHSLIVIPFQFSHCLQVISKDGRKPPELRRANLILSGLLFDERLDVTVRYHQGPFQNAHCRLDDHDDNRKSGLVP